MKNEYRYELHRLWKESKTEKTFLDWLIDETEENHKQLKQVKNNDLLHSVSDSLVADIRNKLSSPKNLCAMLQDSCMPLHHNSDMDKIVRKEIKNTLKNIEYLSNL